MLKPASSLIGRKMENWYINVMQSLCIPRQFKPEFLSRDTNMLGPCCPGSRLCLFVRQQLTMVCVTRGGLWRAPAVSVLTVAMQDKTPREKHKCVGYGFLWTPFIWWEVLSTVIVETNIRRGIKTNVQPRIIQSQFSLNCVYVSETSCQRRPCQQQVSEMIK